MVGRGVTARSPGATNRRARASSSTVVASPALGITDLFKRYPTGIEALLGVSLTIEEGEFFALLGPNGAGKSTLIHCATGLARPTAGTIEVFGHDAIEHYELARLAVGLAPQELNLDWFLTLEETLDFHGGYFGMPRRERRERTAELLDAFSLPRRLIARDAYGFLGYTEANVALSLALLTLAALALFAVNLRPVLEGLQAAGLVSRR